MSSLREYYVFPNSMVMGPGKNPIGGGTIDSLIQRAGAPILWTPAEITTALWLDAADPTTITVTAGKVSEWRDKSGNIRHASQANDGMRPVVSVAAQNGLDALLFNGSNMLVLTSPISSTAEYLVVEVIRAGATSGQSAFSTAGSDLAPYYNDSSNANDLYAQMGTTYGFNTDCPQMETAHRVYSQVYNGNGVGNAARMKAYIDSIAVSFTYTGTIPATSPASTIASIGAYTGDGATLYLGWKSTIAEVVICRAASEDSRLKLEGYLAHKWGLAGSLPSSHPYKTSPPTI